MYSCREIDHASSSSPSETSRPLSRTRCNFCFKTKAVHIGNEPGDRQWQVILLASWEETLYRCRHLGGSTHRSTTLYQNRDRPTPLHAVRLWPVINGSYRYSRPLTAHTDNTEDHLEDRALKGILYRHIIVYPISFLKTTKNSNSAMTHTSGIECSNTHRDPCSFVPFHLLPFTFPDKGLHDVSKAGPGSRLRLWSVGPGGSSGHVLGAHHVLVCVELHAPSLPMP